MPAELPTLRPFPQLQFPRDHGAHNNFRTEWWYVTGQLQSDDSGKSGAEPFGFQVTFFRSRVDTTQGNASAFAAKQIIFAHAAITDVKAGVLLHDDRIARAGFGIAQASEANTDVKLRDWLLVREAASGEQARYRTQVRAREFSFKLDATTTQPMLLQGQSGYSRKGPEPVQASYYVSEPQLAVSGEVQLGAQTHRVKGTAWLDHEWSEAILHPEAVGWDWIGMNLGDGSVLTAFQLRRKDGTKLWAGGSYRNSAASSTTQVFKPEDIRFEPLEHWTSPTTKARYPVRWKVHTPTGIFTVTSVIPNQELDSRMSTGTVYWEGLSELQDEKGVVVGRGYLEMTGYAEALKL